MRVVHVSDVYLPRLGGIELHVSDLARRQRLDGDDAVVVTSTAGPPGADVVRLEHPARRPDDLDRLLREQQVDVVHAHSSLVSPLAWAATRAAAREGVPAVVTMHSLWPRGIAGLALGTVLRGVPERTTWTAVSTAAADALAPALPGRTVGVLPNGVDPADWSTGAGAGPGRPPLIVSVMRTAPRKRPLALLDVLESVRRQVPAGRPIRAVLVGAGPLDRAVRRRIERPGLADWVTATGRLERAGIRRLLERADLYVAPARQESFGIAALEARCAGLPVVGMAGTGLAEFVSDGLDGFLVGSDQEMAAKVAALVRDPVELAAAQEAARRPVPGLGWPAVLARHRALYAAVASARAPVPAGTRPGTADPA